MSCHMISVPSGWFSDPLFDSLLEMNYEFNTQQRIWLTHEQRNKLHRAELETLRIQLRSLFDSAIKNKYII